MHIDILNALRMGNFVIPCKVHKNGKRLDLRVYNTGSRVVVTITNVSAQEILEFADSRIRANFDDNPESIIGIII